MADGLNTFIMVQSKNDLLQGKTILLDAIKRLEEMKITFVKGEESNKQSSKIQEIIRGITDKSTAVPNFLDLDRNEIVFYLARMTTGDVHWIVMVEEKHFHEVPDDVLVNDLANYLAGQAFFNAARKKLGTNRLDNWLVDVKIELK